MGMQATIPMLLHMDTGIEQLDKRMVDGRSPVSHCWRGRLQTSRGRGQDDPRGNGLEAEISVSTHV